MPSRPIAFHLLMTLCWLAAGTPSLVLNTADAGPFFRSSSQRRPTQSYRDRFSSKKTDESKKEETAADRYKAMFENVDTPPAAPKAEANSKSTQLQLPQLTGRSSDTEAMVEEAISRTKKRFLTAGEHTPWQILHGTLALRHEFLIRDGDKLVRALDWLRNGMVHDGLPLVQKTEHGARCHPFTVPWAFEGHKNQFLAILSLSSLPEAYQFRTPQGEIVTMGDMVRHAQKTMDGRGEMTWTLWFLTHYVEPDAEWETAAGQFWSMERLVRMEARQKINGAPCGGTHRLFALSLARNSYLAKHGNVRGAWLEADQVIRKYVATIRALQNRDGSFSSDWFKGRGYSTDLTTRLKTSGHILEWLMVALSDKQLDERWAQLAVQSVARDVIRSSREPAECGALYHALDALTFYKQRKHPSAIPPAASPTYLVPPSQPTTPPSQVVDAAPGRTLQAKPKSTFEQPRIGNPSQSESTIPRMVTVPDEGVRPLAATSDEATAKPQSMAATKPKANGLIVEEIDPATGLPVQSAEPSPELVDQPSVAMAPSTDTVVEESAEAIEVPIVTEPTESTDSSTSTAKPVMTAEADVDTEPTTEDVPTEDTPVDDIPAMVVVPDDVAPLATKLPTEPDAEADPTVVESAEPSSTMESAEPEPVDEPDAAPQLAEEATESKTAMLDDAKPNAVEPPAMALPVDANTLETESSKPLDPLVVTEKADSPTMNTVAEIDADMPRQIEFNGRQLISDENQLAPKETSAGRVELRRRQTVTPQLVITPALPKLPAPGERPAEEEVDADKEKSTDVERVASEPNTPQAMYRGGKKSRGLIVIQLDDYDEIPILVPMKNATAIRRASATW